MFAQVHTPERLSPQELDAYLAQGWFRMGQTIFTTNFLHAKDEMYSTIWLRILLNDYQPDRTQIKLFKRNSIFRTTIQPATVTPEKEDLYGCYKNSVPFQASDSLQQLLYSGKEEASTIYRTMEVTVHHGDELIACGYFDIGATAAEGISSFYNPEYKKYSLGKYLIYQKVQHCRSLELQYFYPGYFVPGNMHFDYKLKIGRPVLEFLQLRSNTWLPIESFSEESIPLRVMQINLMRVQKTLLALAIDCRVVKYDFFDVNLMPQLRDQGLLEFPIFLFFGSVGELSIRPILVFDVLDGQYHVLACLPVWKPHETNPDSTFYSDYFLATREIYSTKSEIEVAAVILSLLKKE